MLGRILLGLLLIIGSGFIVYYAPRLVEVFGRSAWAEQHLGGTKNAIIIGGFFLIVVGFLLMFGFFGTQGPLVGGEV